MKHRTLFSIHLLGLGGLLGLVGPLGAEPTGKVAPINKTIVAVTDLTDAGRELPIPSPAHPVYCVGLNAGFRVFTGVDPANASPPSEKEMLKTIAQALADQGILAADGDHPATQLVACCWGVLGSTGPNLFGPGPGIHFLGGNKMPHVMEDTTAPGHVSADVLRRGFRSGAAVTLLEMSHETLYVVLIRGYDLQAAMRGESLLLWESRLACPALGVRLKTDLPGLVVAGRHVIGRETEQPVVSNFARDRAAWVEIGESTVLEYISLSDVATTKEAVREEQRLQTAAPPPPAAPPAKPAE